MQQKSNFFRLSEFEAIFFSTVPSSDLQIPVTSFSFFTNLQPCGVSRRAKFTVASKQIGVVDLTSAPVSWSERGAPPTRWKTGWARATSASTRRILQMESVLHARMATDKMDSSPPSRSGCFFFSHLWKVRQKGPDGGSGSFRPINLPHAACPVSPPFDVRFKGSALLSAPVFAHRPR